MVWVLAMWLDFEWAVGAFDGKSPPATCWAAISAHYCINVEPYHIIHAVCPRMCWLLCQILVFAIRLDSTKNPAPSAEVVFPNLNNPPCILLPMSLAMQSHHTKRKRFRCFLLHCLNCVLYQPVAKKWKTNGGIIMLRPNFLFLYLLLIVALFLLLSIDMIHCCVPHLLVLVCCMWWWGGGAERELKRNSKQMGVAWKWSTPIYYYFICCWLLHCFSSCQLIRSIVVCPTSWLYFVVWYDGVAAQDKNWREGRRVGRRSTNGGRLRWRSAECLPCPRPRATNRTTNLRDPPHYQLIVVF